MNLKPLFALCVILILLVSPMDSGAQVFDSVLTKLERQYAREKIYLHCDKDIYYPGETIWFKAYLMSGDYPSHISSVLYADLVDSSGTILQHKILAVSQAGASSSLALPPGIEGAFYIRCYSKWMLNFDSSHIYQRELYVSKSAIRPAQHTASPSGAATIKFYPEGGSFITGIPSRVAFKAFDTSGRPARVSGYLDNNRDDSRIELHTSRDGMGDFKLAPKPNTTYKAVWQVDGKQYQAILPQSEAAGVALSVNNTPQGIIYTVMTPDILPSSTFVTIVADKNYQLLYRAKVPITASDMVSGKIPTVGLPAGIVRITVFSQQDVPICQRLVFINPGDISSPINVRAIVRSNIPRGKNVIEIEIPDSISSNVSLSVTTVRLRHDRETDNIYTGLMLDNDLTHYVSKPDLYFSQTYFADQPMDLLMMTCPYKGIEWRKALAGDFPFIKYKPEHGLSVTGQVSQIKKNGPGQKELTGMIQSQSGTKVFATASVKDNGAFEFNDLVFYDSAKLFIQFNGDKNGDLTRKAKFTLKQQERLTRGLQLPIKRTLFPRDARINADTVLDLGLYEKQLAMQGKTDSKILQGVTVSSLIRTKADSLNAEYTSGAFTNAAHSRTIVPEDEHAFLSSQSLLDYLQGRIPGINVSPLADEDPIQWRGFTTAIYVNEISQEMPSESNPLKLVQDAKLVRSLAMSDIALVKIFYPPFLAAWGNGPGGAIAVYTRKSGQKVDRAPKDFNWIHGFSLPETLYSPDYSSDSTISAPDYRTTLYWNPEIIMSPESRKLSFAFFNNDAPGEIRITVEGITVDGRLIRYEKIVK